MISSYQHKLSSSSSTFTILIFRIDIYPISSNGLNISHHLTMKATVRKLLAFQVLGLEDGQRYRIAITVTNVLTSSSK